MFATFRFEGRISLESRNEDPQVEGIGGREGIRTPGLLVANTDDREDSE